MELLENFVKGSVGMEAGRDQGKGILKSLWVGLKGERVDFWVELGAIRGLWDDL
ncbi:hypothetical protein AAG906_035472 [Vitis piasezkii]